MHPHHPPAPERRVPWTTLVLLAVAQFMVVLDVTVVNVALPSIGEELAFADDDLQWVVTAYVLMTGALMLLGGRLADLAGRRPVFLAGLTLFTAASLASGLAASPEVLVASRALQGVGAALLLPAALSIVTTTYEGSQRTKALGLWGAIASAGAAVGVLLGGVITQALGWEAVFFINVPVGLVVGLLVVRRVPSGVAQRLHGRLDLIGSGALTAGLVALVLALDAPPEHGWLSAQALVPGALAVALLWAFAAIERSAATPLVAPATWRIRSLVSGAAVMLVATGVLVGTLFLGTLYLQQVMGLSALETGVAFLPLTLAILAGAHVASHLLPRSGSRRLVAAGLLLAATGAALLAGAPADPSYVTDLLAGYLAIGAGLGLTLVSVSVSAMADVSHENAGLASGLMTTAHEVGAAVGVAVLATVAASAGSLVDGFGTAFLVAGSVAAVAAVAGAFALPSVRPEPGMAHGVH